MRRSAAAAVAVVLTGCAESAPPVRITHVPSAYRLVYTTTSQERTTEERFVFRRPFDGRVETWAGDEPLSVRVSSFGLLASSSADAEPFAITIPPALASGDLRPDAVLAAAVRSRVLARRERKRVLGRSCQVYRAGGTFAAGDLTPYTSEDEFADACIDAAGLVLEEVWVSKGKTIRRRVAVEVDESPDVTDDVFRPPVSDRQGDGSVTKVDGATPRVTPRGFEFRGRYDVVSPRLGEGAGGLSSTMDVFVRGPDLVVVDEGASAAQVGSAPGARTIDVPRLGNAELILDLRASEIRHVHADGKLLRVFGTLPPSQLIALASNLGR